MREGWKEITLDRACTIITGLWKGKKPPFVNIGVIRNTNFSVDAQIDRSDIAFIDVEQNKFNKRRLLFGDIIVEKSGGGPKQPVGRVALFDMRDGLFSLSNFTAALRVKTPSELDFRFLHKFLHFAYLSGVTEHMQSHSTGIRNLNSKAYKAITIPLPPLPEQQRIVAILDEAFESIAKAKANAEQNLKNAREVFENHLQAVFLDSRWQWKKLDTLCRRFEYGSSSKSLKQGKVPVLRMGNIQQGQFILNDLVYTNNEKEIDKYILQHNDVLFNRTNSPELVGKTAIFKNKIPSIFAGYLIRIVRKEDTLDGDYLNYFLNSKVATAYGRTVMTSSVNQANISATKLKNYMIPTPLLAEQHKIVAKFETLKAETQRLESIYQRKIAALDELKKSLLHKAFSGEL